MKRTYWVITTALLFVLGIVCEMKSINIQYKDMGVDFDTIHGEGFVYQDNILVTTQDNAFFYLDIGEQQEHTGIGFVYSDINVQGENGIITLGHFMNIDESDIIMESVPIINGMVFISSDFYNAQFIKIIIDAPIGTSFRPGAVFVQITSLYKYYHIMISVIGLLCIISVVLLILNPTRF